MNCIEKLLRTKQPKAGTVMIIAIDGHGGSGKSTLANELSEKFGAEIIQTDDFASWDNPLNWWPLVIERVFEPIKIGVDTLSYPRSSWWPDHHPAPIENQRVTPVMILEGVSSLRHEFRSYIGIGIFVDTPKDICLQRGIARDIANGQPEDEVTKLWQQWYENEEKYLNRDNPKQYADIVLDGTQPFIDQL